MSNENCAVGIDLGTANSVLALHRKNKTEIISCQDKKIIPSFIFYDTENVDVVIGEPTYCKILNAPENGIYDAKRMIGRSIDDEHIQSIIKNYPFKIVSNSKKEIEIEITHNKEVLRKRPQEVSSEILKAFKKTASEYLGRAVTEAVITVPAYFNFSQRNATKEAAKLAGLDVLMLLNEPTAASLCYISERIENDAKCLVFDLGGGTFDISVAQITGKRITTLGVDGDTFLGGKNIDDLLFNYVIKQHNLTELDNRSKRRLLRAIEEHKKKLSFKETYTTVLEYFHTGGDEDVLNISISKKELETVCDELFQKCLDVVKRCLKQVKLSTNDIDKLIMVGGATKMPKLRKLLSDLFVGKEILTDVNPDEAVAAGAAIQAASIKGFIPEKFSLADVTPFSLGLGIYGGRMSKLIERNSSIPTETTKTYVTTDDNQETLNFSIYEGERSRCKLNNVLGHFVVKNLPPKPAGEVKVVVTFLIDENGLLKIKAKDANGTASTDLEIGRDLKQLKGKIDLTSGVDKKNEDRKFEEFVDTKKIVRRCCTQFVSGKSANEANVKTCIQMINKIDELEFEEKHKLKSLVEEYQKNISDRELVNALASLTIY